MKGKQMNQRDHYNILGLKSNADGVMVNQAYWHLARKYQTLAITDPRARLMLDDLNEAYAVLGTPARREVYDEQHRDTFRKADGIIKRRRPRTRAKPAAQLAPAPKQAHDTRPTAENRDPGPDLRRSNPDRASASASRVRTGIAAATAVAVVGLVTASVLGGTSILVLAGGTAALLAVGAAFVGRRVLVARADGATPDDISQQTPASAAVRSARLDDGAGAAIAARPMSANDLVASTSAMRDRWRDSVGPKLGLDDADREPDLTLVDIFESEREVEADGEPLNAVMDILRGSRATVELH
jgi:hypothetical protein